MKKLLFAIISFFIAACGGKEVSPSYQVTFYREFVSPTGVPQYSEPISFDTVTSEEMRLGPVHVWIPKGISTDNVSIQVDDISSKVSVVLREVTKPTEKKDLAMAPWNQAPKILENQHFRALESRCEAWEKYGATLTPMKDRGEGYLLVEADDVRYLWQSPKTGKQCNWVVHKNPNNSNRRT